MIKTKKLASWEERCEKGRLAAEDMDRGRWIIGDLACDVGMDYGEDLIGGFAKEINVSKTSVMTYRAVCRFYESSLRYDFLEEHPNITFTHMKYAMRLKTLDKAYDILEIASSEGWTTDETAYHIGIMLKNAFVDESQNAVFSSYTGRSAIVALNGNQITMQLKGGKINDLKALVGKEVEITIQELS